MKKIILSLSLLLTTGVSVVLAAAEPKTDPRVQELFKKEFAGAESVQWSTIGDYEKVSFVLGGHRAEAYFTSEGELAGSVRDLFYDQLPLAVMKAVDNRFEGAGILDVREIANSEGTSYKLIIEKKNKKYNLSLSSNGDFIEKRQIR